MTGIEPARVPGGALPLEVRAVAVFLALEVAAGVWFAINWPPGMSLFLSQIPAIGAVGMVWGFLPNTTKAAFGEWFAARLRRPRVWISTAALLASTLGLSCFVNTVSVVGAPPNATWIHLQSGRALRPDGGPLGPSDSLRLRRGTDRHYFWVWTSPVGRRVWLQSSSHLTPDGVTVLPWRPTTVEYPDDFEVPAVLAALPGAEALEEITSPRPWRVVITEAGAGDTLAVDTLKSPGAVLFGFISAEGPPDPSGVFRAEADRLPGGADPILLQMWSDSARSRYTRRPLRANERVKIVAIDSLGKSMSTREVTLNNGLTTTLVVP